MKCGFYTYAGGRTAEGADETDEVAEERNSFGDDEGQNRNAES